MKILHLTLKKKWFDMIASGEKKEEYREKKDYWINRLCDFDLCLKTNSYENFKGYTEIHFRNGYSKDCPKMNIECKGIRLGEGKEEWGAEPGKKYFVIELGEII